MRYEGPYFQEESYVSIWISKVELSQFPNDYFEERFDEEDEDKPLSQWCENFGFGHYDHDFIENIFSETSGNSIEGLLGSCSYQHSFSQSAVVKAKDLGIHHASLVRVFYDYAYQPSVTGIREDEYMIFLDSFPYEKA